jgi:hypothetical protein
LFRDSTRKIPQGIDINAKNHNDETPLMEVVTWYGKEDEDLVTVVRQLLEFRGLNNPYGEKASVNEQCKWGFTALHEAARRKHGRVLQKS